MLHLSKADTHNGAMVALFPSSHLADQLAQDGGEPPDDLHVTLAYLGAASDLQDPDAVHQAVEAWAADCPPLAGEISGTGTFTGGPEPATYASVDLPDLPAQREQLVQALDTAGTPASSEHGYTPHMTLAYDDRPVTVPNHPVVFDHAVVAVGNDRTAYPLTGARVKKADTRVPEQVRTFKPPDPSTDYGQLYYHPGKRAAHYVSGDGDGNGADIHRMLSKLPGLDHVEVSDEGMPQGDGWQLVSRNGEPVSKASISNAPWDGSASRFSDEQWKTSCLLDRGPTFTTAKTRYALPVREPDGAINRKALAAATGRLNTVDAPPDAKAKARTELRRLYVQAGLTAPTSLDKADIARATPLWKGDEDQRIVYGVVLQPGIADSQGDIVSAAEIEKAAHEYLVTSRKADVQHSEQQAPVDVVESFIAPMDMVVHDRPVVKGAWVMASQIHDDALWQRVQKGELTGYSIGGTAVRS